VRRGARRQSAPPPACTRLPPWAARGVRGRRALCRSRLQRAVPPLTGVGARPRAQAQQVQRLAASRANQLQAAAQAQAQAQAHQNSVQQYLAGALVAWHRCACHPLPCCQGLLVRRACARGNARRRGACSSARLSQQCACTRAPGRSAEGPRARARAALTPQQLGSLTQQQIQALLHSSPPSAPPPQPRPPQPFAYGGGGAELQPPGGRSGFAPPPPQRAGPAPSLQQQQQAAQLYAAQAAQQQAQAAAAQAAAQQAAAAAAQAAARGGGGAAPAPAWDPAAFKGAHLAAHLAAVVGEAGQGLGAARDSRQQLLHLGRSLWRASMTVEDMVNQGHLGGFSAFDVRTLTEGYLEEKKGAEERLAREQAAALDAVQRQTRAQAQTNAMHQALLRQAQARPLRPASRCARAAPAPSRGRLCARACVAGRAWAGRAGQRSRRAGGRAAAGPGLSERCVACAAQVQAAASAAAQDAQAAAASAARDAQAPGRTPSPAVHLGGQTSFGQLFDWPGPAAPPAPEPPGGAGPPPPAAPQLPPGGHWDPLVQRVGAARGRWPRTRAASRAAAAAGRRACSWAAAARRWARAWAAAPAAAWAAAPAAAWAARRAAAWAAASWRPAAWARSRAAWAPARCPASSAASCPLARAWAAGTWAARARARRVPAQHLRGPPRRSRRPPARSPAVVPPCLGPR